MKAITKRPVNWIGSAPLRIVETIEIDASTDAVWDVIADHAGWSNWFPSLDSVTETNDIVGVGGTRQVAFSGLVIDEEFLEWEPGSRFGFTVVRMNRPVWNSLNERVDLEAAGDGRCKVTYTQGFEPKWFTKPVMALAKGQIRKGLRAGLAGLKARAESV